MVIHSMDTVYQDHMEKDKRMLLNVVHTQLLDRLQHSRGLRLGSQGHNHHTRIDIRYLLLVAVRPQPGHQHNAGMG